MDTKLLTEVIAAVSAKTLTPEHSHMLKPWEMVFGGLVLPMLAESDPSITNDPKFVELTERYTREKIEEFFRVREVIREKVVEKQVKVTEIKVVEKPVGGGANVRMPTLHQTVEAGGKFRRLKDVVNKVSRKENDIPPDGRDAINKWWNANQKLMDGGDCQPIADFINKNNPNIKPLSAAQVSGWVSWLCRLALKTSADRADYLDIAMNKLHKFSVVPEFTPRFVDEIANNKTIKAEDRKIAAEAKAKMEAEAEATLKGVPVTA